MTVPTKVATSVVAATMALAIPVVAFAGYSPSNRPTFTCSAPTVCNGPDHVVFNSFTNAPNYGDERAFLDSKDAANAAAGGFADSVSVHDGEEILVRAYVHNN